jgi:hypothetical protein
MTLWADEPPQDHIECHDPEGTWIRDLEAQAADKADADRDYLNAETDRLEDEPPAEETV